MSGPIASIMLVDITCERQKLLYNYPPYNSLAASLVGVTQDHTEFSTQLPTVTRSYRANYRHFTHVSRSPITLCHQQINTSLTNLCVLNMDLSAFLSNIDKSAQGIAAALNQFGEHQFGPAVAAAGVVLAEFGKNQIEPIVAEVGQTLDKFGTNILGPAVVEVGRELDEFRTNQLIPVVAKTGSALDGYSKNKLGPAIADARTALDEFAQSK